MKFLHLLIYLIAVYICTICSHKDYSKNEVYDKVNQCYYQDINKYSPKDLKYMLDSVDSTFCKTCIEGGEMFNEIIFKLLLDNTDVLLETMKQEELSGKYERIRLILLQIKEPLADVGVYSEDNIRVMIQNVSQSKIHPDCKVEILTSLYEILDNRALSQPQ